MRAGVDDHVDRPAAGLIEQPRQHSAIALGIGRLPTQFRLRELHQIGRAVAEHAAISSEAGGEIVDIGLPHRRLRAENADRARRAHLRGRLDRGHGADDRQVQRGAHRRQRDGGGGVAGDHDQSRAVALRQPPQQRGHARGDLPFRLHAIGKAGRIGDINEARIRHGGPRGRDDRQPPHPGIEEQDRPRIAHTAGIRAAARRDKPFPRPALVG